MNRWVAVLEPVDVQFCVVEVDLATATNLTWFIGENLACQMRSGRQVDVESEIPCDQRIQAVHRIL